MLQFTMSIYQQIDRTKIVAFDKGKGKNVYTLWPLPSTRRGSLALCWPITKSLHHRAHYVAEKINSKDMLHLQVLRLK